MTPFKPFDGAGARGAKRVHKHKTANIQDRILASKQAANRPKDQRVIPVLQNTLRTLQIKKARRKKAP